MIDVVYILGRGSNWQDNELRYSLRSLEKYAQGIRKVILIGHKPKFVNDNIVHIPYLDIYTNKARNIMAKVYRACSDQRITNNFLFCNDDYFFLKPFNAVEYPFYYKCDLNHTLRVPNNGEYNLHVKPTVDILAATGRNILNFDTHYPIRYNKQMFKHMADSFNWNIPHGYIVKSMYCNFHRFAGTHKLDCKVNHQMPKDHIPGHLAGKEMFSTGESAMNAYMKKHIESLYPEKSKYEL